jgi:hypothetical protein
MRLSSVLRSLLLATALSVGCAFGVSDSPSVHNQSSNSTERMKLTQVLSPRESDDPTGQIRLGIQTQRNVQTPEPLRRSDCEINDECDDYSGLPKSHPGKITTKNFRKPFIGLSITTPLR